MEKQAGRKHAEPARSEFPLAGSVTLRVVWLLGGRRMNQLRSIDSSRKLHAGYEGLRVQLANQPQSRMNCWRDCISCSVGVVSGN